MTTSTSGCYPEQGVFQPRIGLEIGRRSSRAAEEVSSGLRTVRGDALRRRRRVGAMALVGGRLDGRGGRLSDGLLKHLLEPPLAALDADKVDASGEAYQYLKTPDAALGLSVTQQRSSSPDWARTGEQRRPWIPLALAAKVGLDAESGLYLTVEKGSKHRRFYSWCLLAAGLSAALVARVVPEARTAWGRLRSRTS